MGVAPFQSVESAPSQQTLLERYAKARANSAYVKPDYELRNIGGNWVMVEKATQMPSGVFYTDNAGIVREDTGLNIDNWQEKIPGASQEDLAEWTDRYGLRKAKEITEGSNLPNTTATVPYNDMKILSPEQWTGYNPVTDTLTKYSSEKEDENKKPIATAKVTAGKTEAKNEEAETKGEQQAEGKAADDKPTDSLGEAGEPYNIAAPTALGQEDLVGYLQQINPDDPLGVLSIEYNSAGQPDMEATYEKLMKVAELSGGAYYGDFVDNVEAFAPWFDDQVAKNYQFQREGEDASAFITGFGEGADAWDTALLSYANSVNRNTLGNQEAVNADNVELAKLLGADVMSEEEAAILSASQWDRIRQSDMAGSEPGSFIRGKNVANQDAADYAAAMDALAQANYGDDTSRDIELMAYLYNQAKAKEAGGDVAYADAIPRWLKWNAGKRDQTFDEADYEAMLEGEPPTSQNASKKSSEESSAESAAASAESAATSGDWGWTPREPSAEQEAEHAKRQSLFTDPFGAKLTDEEEAIRAAGPGPQEYLIEELMDEANLEGIKGEDDQRAWAIQNLPRVKGWLESFIERNDPNHWLSEDEMVNLLVDGGFPAQAGAYGRETSPEKRKRNDVSFDREGFIRDFLSRTDYSDNRERYLPTIDDIDKMSDRQKADLERYYSLEERLLGGRK